MTNDENTPSEAEQELANMSTEEQAELFDKIVQGAAETDPRRHQLLDPRDGRVLSRAERRRRGFRGTLPPAFHLLRDVQQGNIASDEEE